MAGAALTSQATQSNANPGFNKALGAVSTAAKVISVANSIRQAVPVVQGIIRATPGIVARVSPLLL